MKTKKTDPRVTILRHYITQSGARVCDVADAIGVTDMTIYNWINYGRKVSRLASGPLNAFLVNVGMIQDNRSVESLKLAIDCGGKK